MEGITLLDRIAIIPSTTSRNFAVNKSRDSSPVEISDLGMQVVKIVGSIQVQEEQNVLFYTSQN
jgi:hypothetical protein